MHFCTSTYSMRVYVLLDKKLKRFYGSYSVLLNRLAQNLPVLLPMLALTVVKEVLPRGARGMHFTYRFFGVKDSNGEGYY
jgi:hypothetical protein